MASKEQKQKIEFSLASHRAGPEDHCHDQTEDFWNWDSYEICKYEICSDTVTRLTEMGIVISDTILEKRYPGLK